MKGWRFPDAWVHPSSGHVRQRSGRRACLRPSENACGYEDAGEQLPIRWVRSEVWVEHQEIITGKSEFVRYEGGRRRGIPDDSTGQAGFE